MTSSVAVVENTHTLLVTNAEMNDRGPHDESLLSLSLQMIIRLKKEIQCLKEELALVTGEQRSDQLTQEEIQRYSKT